MKTGCKRWSNCFTCPFSECMWGDETELNRVIYHHERYKKLKKAGIANKKGKRNENRM